ncbi:MAG TPA: hypothetical protein VFE72_00695 [Lysobacter sp.]|nr:hypothetical protein [Lysobacter sp.]
MNNAAQPLQHAAPPADAGMRTGPAAIGRAVTLALALALSACSAQHVKDSVTDEASASACDIVRNREAAGGDTQRRIPPVADEGDGNIAYRFMPSTTSIASLKAVCGHGFYTECEISVALRDGTGYSFVELSRFELLADGDDLWMVYRLQPAVRNADASKPRVVKVAPEPVTLCNEIGDYSDVM